MSRNYKSNSQANSSAFTNRWLRTEDQGYLDRDDYLFITGRLKELINQGGEKFLPREIDEVPLDYKVLGDIWTEVLGIERVGIYDNFFALGGDSLRATQVIARIRAVFQVELSLPKFFQKPTVIGLSEMLAHQVEAESLEFLNQILADLEDLPEEEVQRLLRQEQG